MRKSELPSFRRHQSIHMHASTMMLLLSHGLIVNATNLCHPMTLAWQRQKAMLLAIECPAVLRPLSVKIVLQRQTGGQAACDRACKSVHHQTSGMPQGHMRSSTNSCTAVPLANL